MPLAITTSAGTVASRPADRAGEADVQLGDVGARKVVHRQRVGAAERIEVDGLDVVEIHDDVAQVAGEPHPLAVGGGLEDLVAGAAVEQHGVGAVLALDDVAAVTGIPLEGVVAGSQERPVVALLAVDEIVAVTAQQGVVAVAAEDGVVARAAVDRDADQRGEVTGRREAVIAAAHVELELLGGADVDGERRRIEPIEAHARTVGGDGEDLGAAAAIDLRRVAAGAALEQVGVVARVPDHAVVAALAEHLVVGIAAGQHVVAGAAEQEVEAAAAQQGVVAGLAEHLVVARTACEVVVVRAAEQGCRGQRTEAFIESDDVVVVQAEGLDERGVRDRRGAADHGNRAAIDQNVARSVAAQRDRIAQSIAEH